MPPRVPRVQYLQPTRSFERSGGQATFLHPLAGTQRLENGAYLITPHEASYRQHNPLEILRQQAMNTGNMARIAEKLRLEDPRRKYGMVESALEDAVMAGNKLSPNEEMRLLMQVDSSGKPVGAATFQKGDVYGLGSKDSLDFTQPEPGTLHSLGVLGAQEDGKQFMTGKDYINKAQDLLGNPNLYFETINKPEFSNLEYYYNLGARPTGKVRTGGNPFYEFKDRAAKEAEEPSTDQLRLPGFAGGGAIDGSPGADMTSWDLNVGSSAIPLDQGIVGGTLGGLASMIGGIPGAAKKLMGALASGWGPMLAVEPGTAEAGWPAKLLITRKGLPSRLTHYSPKDPVDVKALQNEIETSVGNSASGMLMDSARYVRARKDPEMDLMVARHPESGALQGVMAFEQRPTSTKVEALGAYPQSSGIGRAMLTWLRENTPEGKPLVLRSEPHNFPKYEKLGFQGDAVERGQATMTHPNKGPVHYQRGGLARIKECHCG